MAIRRDVLARVIGLFTVGYSVAITVSPRVLAEPVGLTSEDGSVPAHLAALIRSIGVRDAALAGALVLAPRGRTLTLLTMARVLSDGADAVWFTRIAGDRATALKVGGAAAGWGAVEAVAGAVAHGHT